MPERAPVSGRLFRLRAQEGHDGWVYGENGMD